VHGVDKFVALVLLLLELVLQRGARAAVDASPVVRGKKRRRRRRRRRRRETGSENES